MNPALDSVQSTSHIDRNGSRAEEKIPPVSRLIREAPAISDFTLSTVIAETGGKSSRNVSRQQHFVSDVQTDIERAP